MSPLLMMPAASEGTSTTAPPSDSPVVIVVAGPTHDRERMAAYGKAIAESRLYERLGGYYINVPRPLATFEGTPPAGYTVLMIRFPSLANAQAFWNSKEYQEKIKPLRQDPSAGDYIVTVYPEAPLRADLAGKVGDNGYTADFDPSGVEQIQPRP
ncbi:DUF1330 domain-containing protein [Blastomonas sp. AAP53]|uniref:DUF1330 domain-containing protein n=1 Tax=Blastomonas sp. AAP53 TaxID=1248760 RepID=UPI0002FC60F4|nr:DUF1330 domain-containing protein [Blastomonas sp. AAP53]